MLGNLCSKRTKLSVGRTGWHLFSLWFWNNLALKCDKMCSIISPRYQNTWKNTKFRTLALNTTRVGPDRLAWLWYSCSRTTVSFLSKLWKVKRACGFNQRRREESLVQHKGVHTVSEAKVVVKVNSRSLALFRIDLTLRNSVEKNTVLCLPGGSSLLSEFVCCEHIKTISNILIIIAGNCEMFNFFQLNFRSMGILS